MQDLPTWISPDGCTIYLSSNRDVVGPLYAERKIHRAVRGK